MTTPSVPDDTPAISFVDLGKQTSYNSRKSSQHQSPRHQKYREPRADQHAGHTHSRSPSPHGNDHGAAKRNKSFLTLDDLEASNSENQKMVHDVLHEFGAIFGARLIETFEARLAKDAINRESAAQALHAQTREALASLRAGSQAGMTHILDSVHRLSDKVQNFGNLHHSQAAKLDRLRRQK
jgi:hypothetical protein